MKGICTLKLTVFAAAFFKLFLTTARAGIISANFGVIACDGALWGAATRVITARLSFRG
ncbi:hypothetical protein Q7C_1488 [Methylophaga frappieri]|uniref:Uncharacterized protein n=1 Tax=Methylophaga frappieri (strain ATCC BAA-2434 / DSM 25690 / JAM7) TaxID=754477 RepID=I1YI94_METFJ|nr:hypothetical protein Q7C_1488 [Methylophaga frappieri]